MSAGGGNLCGSVQLVNNYMYPTVKHWGWKKDVFNRKLRISGL